MAGVIVCDDNNVLFENFFDDGAPEKGAVVVGIRGEELEKGVAEYAVHAENDSFGGGYATGRVPGVHGEGVAVADWEGRLNIAAEAVLFC